MKNGVYLLGMPAIKKNGNALRCSTSMVVWKSTQSSIEQCKNTFVVLFCLCSLLPFFQFFYQHHQNRVSENIAFICPPIFSFKKKFTHFHSKS